MSSRRGKTTPATAVRRRRRRALTLGLALVVALAALAGALEGASTARASSAGHPAAGGRGTVPAALLDATAPPPIGVPLAPGTEVSAGLDQSDPFLTVVDGHYLLLTSGGTAVDPVNVPVVSSADFAHWSAPVDALPVLPAWAARGYTWAPDLHRFGSTYALYFTAMLADRTPQTECIGAAFSPSPTGPFTARATPFICQPSLGGSIDPRVFVDDRGTPWMLWKSDQNIGGAAVPTTMWSQRLAPDGSRLVGMPSVLLAPDRPWQGTIVEAPDMVEVNGAFWLVYSANWYNSPDYAIGAARCAGPSGPCADTSPSPLLASNFQGLGPGEASVFHDAAGVWMLYSPRRSLAPKPDIPPRPVYITRLGFTAQGVYLARGPLPTGADLLAVPLWSTVP